MKRNRFTFSSSDADFDSPWWLAPLSLAVLSFALMALVGVEPETSASAPASLATPVSMPGPTAKFPLGDGLSVAPNLARVSSALEPDDRGKVVVSSAAIEDNHPATF